MVSFGKHIKQQRTRRNMTQEYLAAKLNISRPTYLLIERGERELTISEARKLAALFDVSLEDFLAEQEPPETKINIATSKKSVQKRKPAMRINVPQEKADKFEQTLLYILTKIGGKPNIGQTVLYKLLYFIDFDYYEKFEEQLIGAKYIKNHYGPTPVMFVKFIDRLEKNGQVETLKSKFYKHDQTKYLVNPQEPLDLSALSAQELAHIDWEIDRLGDLTATQISALSHRDMPWKATEKGGDIDYELVFYRSNEFSVREYEPL